MWQRKPEILARQDCTCPPLCFDTTTTQASVGARRLRLTPRSMAVLQHLVERAGQLVGKDDFHRCVWRGAAVSDGALVVCIRELRKELHDDARVPLYIETVHRRGYRFIGPIADSSDLSPAMHGQHQPDIGSAIGRATELTQLQECVDRARNGRRQLVFITGEPGIGKTTLVNEFLRSLSEQSSRRPVSRHPGIPATPRIARGQCVDLYGPTEPYLPILEAVDRLCRASDGAAVIEVLEREAPTWLVQLPGLSSRERYPSVQNRSHGVPQARMLRELAVALEQLSRNRLLVIVLEDLHWSDPSTVNALSVLARRQDPAQLIVIGTYRPPDVLACNHPLRAIKDDLQVHGFCKEISPQAWSAENIVEFLRSRNADSIAPGTTPSPALVEILNHRTEGNPLFVAAMVDDLVSRGVLTHGSAGWAIAEEAVHGYHRVPAGIRQLLLLQGERLSAEDRALLEASSVAGFEFSAAAAAAALDHDLVDIERKCEVLASQGQFLRRSGIAPWPDGTVAARYAFRHAMHQQVWFELLTPTVLQTYHRRIGLRKELAYGTRAVEIAAELAGHFIDGKVLPKAIHYLRIAGANAARRSAHQEAVYLLSLGLNLVKALPRSADLDRQELELQTTLGPVLMAARGYAAPEVERIYAAARKLSVRVGETSQIFMVLYGLWTVYVVRPRHRAAVAIARRLLELAEHGDDSGRRIEAHWAHGCSSFLLGDIRDGHEHFACSTRVYRASTTRNLAYEYGHDPGVSTLSFGAITSWQLGYLDQAVRNTKDALHLAQELRHPFSLAYALTFGAWIHLLEADYSEASRLAKAGLEQSIAYEVPMFRAMCSIFLGTAATLAGDKRTSALADIRDNIELYRSRGGDCICPHFFALYAEACGYLQEPAAGMAAVEEGLRLVNANDERWCEAELYRLRARLVLQDTSAEMINPSVLAAEEDFVRAIDISRRQHAITPALRASVDYARLLSAQGRGTQARALLNDALVLFREGYATADLRTAFQLLDSLSTA